MKGLLPGVGDWQNVWLLRDLWHFHFYGETPLKLVAGRERIYFEHFWNDFAADPKHSVPEADRQFYAEAYAQPGCSAQSQSRDDQSLPPGEPPLSELDGRKRSPDRAPPGDGCAAEADRAAPPKSIGGRAGISRRAGQHGRIEGRLARHPDCCAGFVPGEPGCGSAEVGDIRYHGEVLRIKVTVMLPIRCSAEACFSSLVLPAQPPTRLTEAIEWLMSF